jgi:hypothetical protein
MYVLQFMSDLPRPYLIHDEVEHIPDRNGRLHPFQIRVWRRQRGPAIVHVSETPDGPPPASMAETLANDVFSGVLGFAPGGMRYFEDSGRDGGRVIHEVVFETFGHGQRSRLWRPWRAFNRKVTWLDLECLVRERIER